VGDIFSFIKEKNLQIQDIDNSSNKIIQLLEMIESGTISSKVAKDILVEVLQNNKEPSQLVKELGLEQVSDNDELEKIVDDALKDEEDNIMKFQSGSDRVLGYFVGKCLKATKGKGNPKVINELLLKKLNK
jgi:aspartyl-tRNA(Asn)/glutamyl-tRNA(Gln) amidotransferase subunit B